MNLDLLNLTVLRGDFADKVGDLAIRLAGAVVLYAVVSTVIKLV